MKEISKSILLLSILILVSACNTNLEKEEKYTIIGQVTGFPDGTKFYLRNLATDAVFDSTIVENNSFKLEGQLSSPPEQIWLNARVDKQFIYTNLLIGNDNITVKGDKEDFPWNVEITGSKIQEEFNYSQSLIKDNRMRREALVKKYFSLPKEKQEEQQRAIWSEIKVLDSITKDLRLEYVKRHPDTYSSIINLGYLKNDLPKETIQEIYDKYSPEIKESKYAKVVEVFLRESISRVGDKYHDFEGLNQFEEKVKFSEIKGEYTLIDFTSAYCGPCIQAADELIEISRTYVDSMNIISFSGDPKKEDWLRSVERDRVAWNSIWDGKGRYSETSIKYGINGYPTFVLINPDGIIIDKWSGYGEGSLKARLEKHFF